VGKSWLPKGPDVNDSYILPLNVEMDHHVRLGYLVNRSCYVYRQRRDNYQMRTKEEVLLLRCMPLFRLMACFVWITPLGGQRAARARVTCAEFVAGSWKNISLIRPAIPCTILNRSNLVYPDLKFHVKIRLILAKHCRYPSSMFPRPIFFYEKSQVHESLLSIVIIAIERVI
jgi:hypothetical protein